MIPKPGKKRKRRKNKKRNPRQILTRKIDAVFKQYARGLKSETCEICGISKPTRRIDAHHYIGCRNMRLRWDLRNIVVACSYHHKNSRESFHQDVIWGENWMLDHREDDLIYLENVRNEIRKWTLDEMQKLYNKYKKLLDK